MPVAFDVVVVGAGMAGFSAAVFTSRAGLKTLVIGDPSKAMLAFAAEVGNYLGQDGLSGPQILENARRQVEKYGASVIVGEVVHAVKADGVFLVKTADAKEFTARALVIATGTQYKASGIPGEEKFKGHGVHYCVACDGPFFKNKKVAVIGSGTFAAEEALELVGMASDISIISNGQKFSISKEFVETLSSKGVKMGESRVREIKGDKFVSALVYADGREEPFNGVFVALGTATALDFALKLGLDVKNQAIVVGKDMKTSMDGVYAAGSCTGGNVQIAKSVGDGCNAAISIIKKLKGIANYEDHT
jgi:thioredoxin reductase (NADPH)